MNADQDISSLQGRHVGCTVNVNLARCGAFGNMKENKCRPACTLAARPAPGSVMFVWSGGDGSASWQAKPGPGLVVHRRASTQPHVTVAHYRGCMLRTLSAFLTLRNAVRWTGCSDARRMEGVQALLCLCMTTTDNTAAGSTCSGPTFLNQHVGTQRMVWYLSWQCTYVNSPNMYLELDASPEKTYTVHTIPNKALLRTARKHAHAGIGK